MFAAQPGGDGQFPRRSGAAHLVQESAALGGEQGGEGEVVHPDIVDQSVDGVRPAAVSARRGRRSLEGSDTMWLVRQNDEKWAGCPLRRAVPAARRTGSGTAGAGGPQRFRRRATDGGFAGAGAEAHP
ncbi:hypothetical protein GCM10022207_37000 [Streptomyces lannensis]|uniref:Uncharacterized protein n=1 Tax=Streptomyces lannensis TaxID=766498 RepID=A0ABP7K809_9ACTN